jgi:hypothetical protein
MYHYYVGLDLGQSRDYTALAVIEEPVWIGDIWWKERFGLMHLDEEGWVSPATITPHSAYIALQSNYHHGRPAHPPLYLRHLHRFELGTRYPDIIRQVKELLLSPPIRPLLERSALLVDKTGVGAAVVDSFKQAGVNPLSVTIHGGSSVTPDSSEATQGFRVPKRDLVAAVQTLLQSGRLKIAESLELAPTLKQELLNFRVKIDPKTAHDSYEHWRENQHDDLVLATALACWFREYKNRHLETRNAKGGRRVAM